MPWHEANARGVPTSVCPGERQVMEKERSEHGGEEDAQMDVEDMPESDLDAGCSAEADLEGV